MKRTVLALVAAVVLGLAFAQPSGTLTIAQQQDPQSWDPIDTFYLAWGMIGSSIFDGLVHRDLNMKIGPGLATSWEWTDASNTRLRFHLRQGVTFQDGEPFNAAAVKFTFDRLLGPEGAKGPQQANYTSIDHVEVVDDSTVDFVMKSPDPVLITKLAGYGAMIVPPKYVTDNTPETFNKMPIGTGPFKVTEYVPDDHLTLVANPDYWGGAPKVAKVIFRFIPEPSTRVAELQAGRADIVQGIPISLADTVSKTQGVKLEPVGSPTVNALRFNFCLAPTDNIKVREAIAHAVDSQGIIDSILQGYGIPISSFQSSMSLGYDPNLTSYAYDPELSKKLLSEAGVAAGTPVGIDITATDATFKEVAQVIASELEAVGLKPTIASHETNTYYNELVPKNTVGNLYYSGWGGWTLDFDNTAYLLYHTKQFWNPCYSNPKLDALLEQERGTYDQSQREQILQQVAQIEHDDLIDLPLYQSKNLWGVADRVQGFVAPADDRNDLTNVSVSN